jgi:hypothetical protein
MRLFRESDQIMDGKAMISSHVKCALTLLQLALVFPALGAEVRFIAVSKGMFWDQTGPGAPVQQGGNSFQFRAHAELVRPDAISSASLSLPSPSTATRQLAGQGTVWEHVERFSSRAALNNGGPNGTYKFVVQSAADGRRTNVVTLSADVYPLALRVANFVEAQTVDGKADFTLRWDAANYGANGFVQVRILDGEEIIFQSPSYPQAAGALNGSAGAVVIPRNTLDEGMVYRGEITIWRRVTEDSTGYPGVRAWAAYTQTTVFPLRTQFSETDAYWYGFAKTRRYEQTSANPPAPNGGSPAEFMAFADATAAANILGASIVTAGGGTAAFLNFAGSWRIRETFPSQQAMEARFPAGALNLVLHTAHNGIRNLSLSLPNGSYPAAPQISNFHEANVIDAAKPFVLRWNPLTGGGAGDFVQVRIRKGGAEVLRSGDHPLAPGALNGTSTSFNLPANLLAAGEGCEVEILFMKAASVDTFSYPKVVGICGFAGCTTATIRARGGNVTTPVIRDARRLAGSMEWEFSADPGRQYVVQSSSNLSVWTDSLVTNAPNANFRLRFNINAGQRQQIFRLLTR